MRSPTEADTDAAVHDWNDDMRHPTAAEEARDNARADAEADACDKGVEFTPTERAQAIAALDRWQRLSRTVARLDNLPITAVDIGYRTDSTEAERALANALFKVHETWMDVKP